MGSSLIWHRPSGYYLLPRKRSVQRTRWDLSHVDPNVLRLFPVSDLLRAYRYSQCILFRGYHLILLESGQKQQ